MYMTTDIRSEGLVSIYKALEVELSDGNIAIKLNTGRKLCRVPYSVTGCLPTRSGNTPVVCGRTPRFIRTWPELSAHIENMDQYDTIDPYAHCLFPRGI